MPRKRTNPSGDTVYTVRVRDGRGGFFPAETFRRKVDADRREAELKVMAKTGQAPAPRHGRTVGDWLEEWHGDRDRDGQLAPKTVAAERSRLDAWLLPHLGRVPLAKLGPADLRRLQVAMRDAGRSETYVGDVFKTLTTALNHAREDGLIRDVPRLHRRHRVKPDTAPKEYRIVEPGELATLVEACGELGAAYGIGPTSSLLVEMAAATGMRWGELVGLRARYVDLDAGTVRVASTISEVRGHLIEKEPKTAASRRTIALPAYMVARLREWPVVGDGLVFAQANGQPIRYSNWRPNVWVPAAGQLPDPRPRFHDLRHTHATALIAAGRPIPEVQARLGHTKATTTLNIYAHYLEGGEGSADVIDALFGGNGEKSSFSARGEVVELGR